jgi:PKD repeat protein
MKTRYYNKVGLFMLYAAIQMVLIDINAQQDHTHSFRCGGQVPQGKYLDAKKYEYYRNKELELMQNILSEKSRNGDTLLVVPIVFHIVHEYGVENISDAQINDAVRILNEDFKKLNNDTAAVLPPFNSIIGNPQIEFRLAKIDPNGNCTNGIDRIYSLETRVGDDGSKFNAWPREKYLNIWVVKSMQNGVAGYAYYPSSTESIVGPFIDGIIILHQYIGSVGSGTPGRSRALTHEIGHYLGLAHTWGNTNNPGVACGDDGITDTPITRGWSTCNVTSNAVCNPGTPENVQNYMEYSYCSNMFTKGQALAMRFILSNEVAMRNNLWSDENREATGVDLVNPLCKPIADFTTNTFFACAGETVSFIDKTYNGPVDNYLWTFSNASPSTSTLQNPSVVFNTSGWQTVTLTVSNAVGSDTHQFDKLVYISNDYSEHAGLYIENFENRTNQIANFLYPSRSIGIEHVTNPVEVIFGNFLQNASWDLASNAGASGNKSMRLNAHNTNNLMVDELITPAYDLTLLTAGFFTFKFSSTTTSTNIDEMDSKLRIYSSLDCGKTWQLRSQINDFDLVNAGFCDIFYVPNANSTWDKVDIIIPANLRTNNVRFKFEYTSGSSSNNLYLDDIGIEGVLSQENEEGISAVYVYPNPSTSLSNITLNITSTVSDILSVDVYNSLGQVIKLTEQMPINVGSNSFTFSDITDRDDLAKGMYIISLKSDKLGVVNRTLVLQ